MYQQFTQVRNQGSAAHEPVLIRGLLLSRGVPSQSLCQVLRIFYEGRRKPNHTSQIYAVTVVLQWAFSYFMDHRDLGFRIGAVSHDTSLGLEVLIYDMRTVVEDGGCVEKA